MTKQLIENIVLELQQKIYLSGESCSIAQEILEKHLLPQEPTHNVSINNLPKDFVDRVLEYDTRRGGGSKSVRPSVYMEVFMRELGEYINIPQPTQDLHTLLGQAFTILCNKDTRSEEDRLMRKQLEMWLENNSMNIDFSKEEPTQEQDLSKYGYAPGDYLHMHCDTCRNKFTGEKGAWNCEECALKLSKLDFGEEQEDKIEKIEYVQVPKEIYDKMVGECTLAAVRRGDFTDMPMTEEERVTKNGGVYIGD